jgi:hypothetical protein
MASSSKVPASDYYLSCIRLEEIKVNELMDRSVAELQVPEAPTLFHYTDTEGLLGILKTAELWASDIRCMNDATELSYSISLFQKSAQHQKISNDHGDFFREIISEVADNLLNVFRIFAVSFSELHDDLAQWRAYGSSTGCYAIGFDFAPYRYPRSLRNALADNTMLVKVIYDADDQVRLLQSVINLINEGAVHLHQEFLKGRFGDPDEDMKRSLVTDFSSFRTLSVADLLLRFKHPEFHAEKEWRLVNFVIDPDAKLGNGELALPRSYRIRRGALCPYVQLQFPTDDRSASPRLPLKSIRQGPTHEAELRASFMQECLVSFGYDEDKIPVEYSQVPLRF